MSPRYNIHEWTVEFINFYNIFVKLLLHSKYLWISLD